MWTILTLISLTIIFFIILKSFSNKGRMQRKYRTLITSFKKNAPETEIFARTPVSISFGVHNAGGLTSVTLIQPSIGGIFITWEVESSMYGKHSIDWRFPEDKDQGEIAKTVIDEAIRYQKDVIAKHHGIDRDLLDQKQTILSYPLGYPFNCIINTHISFKRPE